MQPDDTGLEPDSLVGVADPPPRDRGRFRRGESGNPAGRPRGSRNRVTERARDLLDGASEDLVQKLIDLARGGERFALRLVMERVVPTRRDRRVEIGELLATSTAGDLVTASGQVIALAASGEITLEEAQAYMKLLAHQRAAIDAADLHTRVEVLEQELERERSLRR